MDKRLELGFRDAIHVPYVVVQCDDEDLEPGTKVSLRQLDTEMYRKVTRCVRWTGRPVGGDAYTADDYDTSEPMWHGVVDPFLESPAPKGTPFRFMLRPECFRGMRHDFDIEVHDRGGTSTCHSVCDIF